MPQLIPFYFSGLLTYGIGLLCILIFIYTCYLLPLILKAYLSRLYISKI